MEILSYAVSANVAFWAIVFCARWIVGMRAALRLRTGSRILAAVFLRRGPWLACLVVAALWYYWPTDYFIFISSGVVTAAIAVFWLYWIDKGKARHPGRKATPRSRDVA